MGLRDGEALLLGQTLVDGKAVHYTMHDDQVVEIVMRRFDDRASPRFEITVTEVEA